MRKCECHFIALLSFFLVFSKESFTVATRGRFVKRSGVNSNVCEIDIPPTLQ